MQIDTSGWVKGPALLEQLFADEKSRPKPRTLRSWVKKRIVPHYKIGRFVYFDVDKVRAALVKRNYIREL